MKFQDDYILQSGFVTGVIVFSDNKPALLELGVNEHTDY
jgi:hypothetical protein